jgi:ArsR family transcriptional regulator, arsenate/arsenite/antimonite-responsive transcriptional repressor
LKELKLYLRAIGDATRLRILQGLAAGGELKVSDISLDLRLSQPLTSWHLRILKKAELVVARRNGRQIYYGLNRPRIAEYQRCLEELMSFSKQ